MRSLLEEAGRLHLIWEVEVHGQEEELLERRPSTEGEERHSKRRTERNPCVVAVPADCFPMLSEGEDQRSTKPEELPLLLLSEEELLLRLVSRSLCEGGLWNFPPMRCEEEERMPSDVAQLEARPQAEETS